MDDLTFVVSCLIADGKDKWETVAKETGVPVDTIIKVARRQTLNPRFYTINPLIAYYQAREQTA